MSVSSYEIIDQEVEPAERILAARLTLSSIRGISRATGIPYSTLQAITSGVTKNPRASTLQRIADAFGDLIVTRTERGKTYAFDTPLWTPDKLTNLQPPAIASSFQLVYWASNLNRAASTGWRSLADEAPSDYVMQRGIAPSSIRRVIFNKLRGGS